MTELTEVERIQAALAALAEEMGSKSVLNFTIESRGRTNVFCRPKGYGDSWSINKWGRWDEAILATREEWLSKLDEQAERTINDMALAIVRITFDSGSCTDAQLRAADFDAADVIRYGGQAVTRANEMADSGPFTITLEAGANDAGEVA